MKLSTACMGLMLLAAGNAVAAPARAPMGLADEPQKIVYPGGVTGLRDIAYNLSSGFRPLTLDLYKPRAGKYLVPAVIYVHGGGWSGGSERQRRRFRRPAACAGGVGCARHGGGEASIIAWPARRAIPRRSRT